MNRTTLTRRGALGATLGAAALAPSSRAIAQAPGRAARIVVGFPAGGSSDTVARLLAERLRGTYAQQLVIENRTGAGGRVAIDAVKAAAPDGATVLQTPASMLVIYPHLYPRSLRYDALTDFVPVSPVCIFPFALMVAASHPARDFAGFVAWAKAQGGPVLFASPAAGSMPHFVGVQMAKATGIQLTHVPYRGTAPAVQDLLAGQIPMVLCVLGEATELHRAGQTRILAISAAERLPRLPELPTFAELGHPALTSEEWFGMLMPAGTPAATVEALHAAITEAARMRELTEALARLEYRPLTEAPAAFAARIRAERERWGPIVRESGFNPEE